MKYKQNLLSRSIHSTLGAGAVLSMALASGVAFAQEGDADEEAVQLDRVEVTGTRIKRVDVEGATPITIISRADIDMSGDTSVAEVLRNLSANTFGSWKGRSGFGNGAPGSVEVNLRGIGATLVLIDGRRMAGAGYGGGQTQNLNNIPVAIVDRIEVLRGGASAIYGSDAIAGVINIITLREMNGVSASFLYENRSVDDGTTKQFEFAGGVSTDRGNIIITAQGTTTDELADTDVSGFDNGVSWYSPVANVFYASQSAGGFVSWFEDSLCENVDNTIDQGFRCGYAYSNVTWLFPQQDRNSIMAKMNYELTDKINFNARLSYTGNTTVSRFAPTPVSTNTVTMQFDNPNAPADVVADIWDAVDPNLYIYTRTALMGTRDATFNDIAYDMVFGLDGYVDVLEGMDWEVNYQYTLKIEDIHNTNLVNDVLFQAGLDDGTFDLFNVAGLSQSAWEANAIAFFKTVAHTGITEFRNERNIFDGTFGGMVWSNDSMIVSGVVGGEFENLDFTKKSDPASAAGFISGGSGGDDVFAVRDRTSLFAEVAVDFDFGLELSVATRYDEYDQTGDVGAQSANRVFDDTTYMFTAAYRPTDNILLRGAVGTQFRAPTMNELFASQSFGFPSVYDYYYCDTQGNPGNDAAYCDATNNPQVLAWSGGNPTLAPEFADTMNFGFVWQITDDLSFEAGWYDISYVDRIAALSLDEIMRFNDQAGGNTPAVIRGSNGQVESIQGGVQNFLETETSGIDFAISYVLDTNSIGRFTFTTDASYVLEYINVDTDDDGNDIRRNIAGERGLPNFRANHLTQWSYGDFFASWRMNYIAGQDAPSDAFNAMDAVLFHNLRVGYNLPWDAEIAFGVRNVTEELPQYYTDTPAWRNYNQTLYNPYGRELSVRYKQDF